MQDVTDWLSSRQGDMVALWQKLVDIDSGSYDKPGVDAVISVLQDHLTGAGVACERMPVAERGDILRAHVPGCGGGRPALLLGHCDTVFAKGEAVRRPFTIRGDRAYGPGVADMKGGLVLNTFILEAYAACGGAPVPIDGLYTSDEEIGSVHSRPFIEAAARGARCVFNAEPGRVSGNVVTGRRGGLFFRCDIEGKPAHSGLNFEDGRSAILALARKIDRWMALPASEPGTTANVGLISGGQAINMVAPDASCTIDLRYADARLRDHLVRKIEAIAEAGDVEGTRAKLTILGEFDPMVPTPESTALFELYADSARRLGFEVGGETTKSCADSGLTSRLGIPTLCGTGPVGGKAHTPDEYALTATLVPRAQAIAATIARLAPDR